MSAIDDYLDENKGRFESELIELLKIPSVSADSKYDKDMLSAAKWLEAQFKKLNLKTEIIPTDGQPFVYAESPPVKGATTVLVYGHYDVQPAEMKDGWTSDPFEPVRKDGNLVARGATDDKGQLFTHIKSLEAVLSVFKKLPLQVKFLIEGEEEVGSKNLYAWLPKLKEKLACDIVVISDTCQYGPGQPAITYGLRGICSYEVKVQGATSDLHSGTFGGVVGNPLLAVCQMMAGLKDAKGKITVPGFYDDVESLTERERGQMRMLDFDEKSFMDKLGVEVLPGEEGYTALERKWARPSFDVHGLLGGYQGEGSKTVLPCAGGAKFSFRLVPNQEPAKITAGLKKKLAELCPPGVTYELIERGMAQAVIVPIDSPYVTAAVEAIEKGFGRSPVFIREGGSIPIVLAFKQELDADTLLLGWGLDDDNAHGPDEKFSLADFHRGIRASAALWSTLAAISKK
jgi:acetylornithine deacetylase/succinyl-diaminopimelate desuccinylase-like protein